MTHNPLRASDHDSVQPTAAADSAGAVAIIGMAGRFPGARDLDELWRVIAEGRDTISRFSHDDEEVNDPDLEHVRNAENYVRARGVLDDIAGFDAAFFDFTPAEAASTDPQHRVWLETAWQALEAAGYARPGHGQLVSVFAGSFTNTYLLHNLLTDRAAIEEYVRMRSARSFATLLQNDAAFLPSRTAYKLDLRGPAINVQTACSTSLVAVALAVQSLRNFESDISIAGGVCIAQPERSGYFYQEGAIFARDGVCRPYDKEACGTVFGNGVGAVVLKRLDDALRDGDPIRAVILGAALNNDGHGKVGFAAPSVTGQAEVIVAAQTVAGVSPDSIGYIEGHGTATPMGDPIEVEALTRAFRTGTQRNQFCVLGSLKGNIGHLDAAAGVAGLIRAVLALEQRTLPPTAHFSAPNPELRLEQTPFFVCGTAQPWPQSAEPRRAGVSAFGIGGTNAHVILEEAPDRTAARHPDGEQQTLTLLISAKSDAALDANTERLAQLAEQQLTSDASPPALSDVAFALHERKQLFEHRRAVRVDSWPDAALALRDPERWASGLAVPGKPKVFFAFPGQGSLWPGQLVQLLAADASLRAELEPLARAASELIHFDLWRWLNDESATLTALRTDNAKSQLAVFCIDVALARWLERHGVVADGFVGHSLGEWAAAHLAGILDAEAALRAVHQRGRLMQSTGVGAALIVRLPEQAVGRYLEHGVSLACVNSRAQLLLSGSIAAIEACAAHLVSDGVAHRLAPIDVAVHSAHMDAVIEPFRHELAQLQFSRAHRPVLSSVTGQWLTPEAGADLEYWAQQIRKPVLFDRAAETLFAEPCCIALEVGLGNALTGLLAAGRRVRQTQRALALLGRHDEERPCSAARLQIALGELWANGAAIDLIGRLPQPSVVPTLPTYAFQRQRHLMDAPALESRDAGGTKGRTTQHGHGAAQTRAAAVSGNVESLRQLLLQTISAMSRLPVDQLDVAAGFAELGLDSVFLAELSERLQHELGIPVRFSQLVSCGTIERLAQALAREHTAPSVPALSPHGPEPFQGLVSLHAGDDRVPILLIHGDGADNLLPPLLPDGQSLFGYLHQGSDGEHIRLRSVQALAAHCHEEWLARCADAPCILAGHSFGGLIAYELACLRRAAGLPVSLLVLLDVYAPQSLRAPHELSLRAGHHLAQDVLHTVAWGRDIARAELQLARGSRVPLTQRTQYVRAVYELATLRYHPRTLDADTLLFRASEKWAIEDAPGSGWRGLIRGRYDVQEVSGDHLSIVRTKQGFAPIAEALLQRAAALRAG